MPNQGVPALLLQASLREGATQPPPRLFERDLIAAMEWHGIGTDATVAGQTPRLVQQACLPAHHALNSLIFGQ